MSQLDDANGVRALLEAVIARFPIDRIVRHAPPGGRHDQVAVTHLGQTTVYASPRHLQDALLQANHVHIDRHIAAGVDARLDAEVALAIAAERRRAQRDGDQLVARLFSWALLLAVLGAIAAFAWGAL